jgi:hypothetical protein
MKARPLSINRPYGTFAGHTRSQLRQVRQRSRCDRSRGLSGRSPRASARIKAMRPRGDSFSVRASRYVGQCGRHRPQATQRSASYLIFDARSKVFTADPRPAKGSSQRSHVSAHAAMRKHGTILQPGPVSRKRRASENREALDILMVAGRFRTRAAEERASATLGQRG